MSGIAILAKQKGHDVTGSDLANYDPIKSVLEKNNINTIIGYKIKDIKNKDLVIIGNVMSRGNPDRQWVIARDLSPSSSNAEEQIGTLIDSSWFGKSMLSLSLNLLPIRVFVDDFAAATTQTGRVNSFKSFEELTIEQIP